MKKSSFTDQQLEAYLDESLSSDLMAEVESRLRCDEALRLRLLSVVGRREAGVHGLGEIWRRLRLSCPTRQQLGSYLLGAIEEEHLNYIRFHLEIVQCRWCNANVEDLRSQQTQQQALSQSRRRRYFQTSAGYLKRSRGP